MKINRLLVPAFCLSVAFLGQQFAAAQTDKQRLQGAWELVSSEQSGKPAAFKPTKLVFDGDKVRASEDNGPTTEKPFTLDTARNPTTIDFVSPTYTFQGLYLLEKDRLTLCWPFLPSDPRPSELAAKPGSRTQLLVFKRVAQGDKEKIQGTWKVVSIQDGGRKHPNPQNCTVRIDKEKLTAKDGDKTLLEATYQLDSKQKPRWIDLTHGDKKEPGIYELKGDDLKICLNEHDAERGNGRPTEFASQNNSANDLLIILKRAKQ